MFRGFVFDYFFAKTAHFSTFINAILFGLAHGGILPQHYVTGYVYSKVREKDGDIYGVILLHIFNNFIVDLRQIFSRIIEVFTWCSMVYFFLFILLKFIRKDLNVDL